MPGIDNIKSYGWMAQASYLDMTGLIKDDSPQALSNVLRNSSLNADKRFAAAQADEFVGASVGFSFQAYQPNTVGGFSATVFKSNSDASYTIAVRGTEASIADLFNADFIGVVLSGFAKEQLFSAYRFYKQLTTAKDVQVSYTSAELAAMAALVTGRSNPLLLTGSKDVRQDFGVGVVPAGGQLRFAGHSLGGHVAVLLAEMIYQFQLDPNIQTIRTFNSPGIGGIFPELGNWLGIDTTITGGVIASKTLNLIGEGGLDVTSGLASVFGAKQTVFIETDGLVTGNLLAGNHSIVKLSDSLAFQSLLTSIDSGLAIDAINKVEKALSNEMSNTLEKGVEALYKIFIGNGTSITVYDREQLYSRLADTKAAIEQISGISALQFKSLVNAEDVVSLAKSDVAYRYALRELNPFAILGTGYSQFNAQGQLDLYNPSTEKGLTDKWLEARAQALAAKMSFNTVDGALTQQPEFAVDDKLSGFGTVDRVAGAKRLVFGTGDPNTLSGAIENDKIFGGSGGDTIFGGPGDDYIEGNDGFDTIDAGMGDDEVYGGEGNDTISGFTGVDKLNGGAGEDTIDGGLGDDIIYGDKKDDPDSTTITGDDTIDGGWGVDRIWGGGGVDTIHGGRGDDKIEGNAGNDTLYGDEGVDTIKGGAGIDTIYGGADRDTIEGGDDVDIIYGGENATDNSGPGNAIDGGSGDDKLYGDGGMDAIDGGTGKDLLVGNFGKDTLTGGTEDDEIYGDLQEVDSPLGDDDQLDGGAGNDVLEGGGGRDELLGGDGDDKLRGGKGVGDYMVGGIGDDTYFYRVDDGADLIYDVGGDGKILYEGQRLNGGANRTKGSLTWYDGDPCDADFTYSATSDPNEGPVTLTIWSKAGGLLRVFDFDNGELGINLSDGSDPKCGPRPPTPSRQGQPPRGDPLVLDLGSAGIATYGLASNLYFDMDGDGFAEKTGWAGAQEGVLVYDRNADGILNDGQELFGDFTRLAGGQLATGGFQALSAHDANHDGKIDALDPVWSSLRVGVWETDPFGALILGDPKDAMSLKGLEDYGIASISVGSSILTGAVNPDINVQTRTGTYTLEGGATREVAEFRFARDNAETKFQQNLPVPEENADDPSLPMGGLVMNLQQALIRDDNGGYLGRPAGSLRAKLDAFKNETDPAQWFGKFEALLFAWTGVDAIPAGAKTGPFDARHAAVLEKAYGQSFQNPNFDQWAEWQTTYERLADAMYSSLLSETHLEPYYDAIDWAQNVATGALYGDLAAPQAMLDADAAADAARGRSLAIEFGRSLRGLGHTQDTSYYALREHFIAGGTDRDLGFAFDAAGTAPPYKPGTYVAGIGTYFTSLSEAVHFTSPTSPYGLTGDDIFYTEGPANSSSHLVGTTGTNVLVATDGDDLLWAHEGDDLLDGGAGDDTLKGLAGNDVYIFRRGSGTDTIQEIDGIDTVFFGSGLRRQDLVARRMPDGGFELQIAGTDDVLVIPAPQSWVPSPHGGSLGAEERSTSTIERFMFDDGTLIRLQDFVQPTEGDDDFVPLDDPFDDSFDMLGGDDRVDGRKGNDTLFGGAGDDTLIGGLGNDVLWGGTGNDRLLATSDEDYLLGYYRYFDFAGAGATNGNDEYRFGFGDGSDTLIDLDRTPGNLDSIALGAGVTPDDVTLFAEGDDMVVLLSSGDRLTVKGHYRDGGVAIERIKFPDGTIWSGDTLSTVTRIGTPGDDQLAGAFRHANHLIGGGGDDVLTGALEADLLEGGDGDDTLGGGEGADLYDGGAGDDLLQEPVSIANRSLDTDVFLFGRGDGNDTLVSRRVISWWWSGIPADDDVVRFKAGVAPEDLAIEGVNSLTHSTDIVVRIADEPDTSLRIEGFLDGRQLGYNYVSTVRRFEFADGTAWDYDQIAERLQWIGTEQADTLRGSQRNETISGLGGDDTLAGAQGNDLIDGGAGDDILYGGSDNDTLLGGEGDDRLEPGFGNDTVDGGVGNDLIGLIWAGPQFDAPQLYNLGGWATPGDLTVLFGRGDGRDTIQVANARADSNDTLRLKPGVAPEDIALARVRDDLVLDILGTQDRVTVRNWFLARDLADSVVNPFRIENIAFDDGSVLDAEAIRARILVGGEGNDVLKGYDDHDDLVLGNGGDDLLYGGGGDDRLVGGAGNDVLEGGGGADVYGFSRGDGNDSIFASGGEGAVEFDAGIATVDVLVRNRGGNMVLTLDSGEDILVAGQFLSPGDATPIAEVRFDGGASWDADTLRELALQGTDGDDYIQGFDWGDDTIAGGAGYDDLEGGYGDDLYVFGEGDGYDYVYESGGFDALSFGGLLPSEVEFFIEGHDLYASILGTGETVDVVEFFSGSYLNDTIEQFLFDDGGFVLSAAEVLALTGSDSEEQIFGTPDDDVLEGGGQRTLVLAGEGNDLVFGGDGDDELHGGDGDDEMYGDGDNDLLLGEDGDDYLDGSYGSDVAYGGAGADALYGGEGSDDLVGEDGDDTLVGGEGNDFIEGGAGADTIVLGRGDGLDDIFADPFSGVREGFEQAHGEALQELSELDAYGPDDIYSNSTWNMEEADGFARGLAPDLLGQLLWFEDGLPALEAKAILEELEYWLTTPLRPDSDDTDYAALEAEARSELFDAFFVDEDGIIQSSYWADLDSQQNIPNDVFFPLLGLDDGLDRQQAAIFLNGLLGWLYESPFYADDQGGEINPPYIYGEMAFELEDVMQTGGFYFSDYWSSVTWALPISPELEEQLLAMESGLPVDEAASALKELRNALLGREGGAGGGDTIEFGEDLNPDDLEIAVAEGDSGGIVELAIGFRGTNDGVTISDNGHGEVNTTPVSGLSVQRFRFDDGTELTLQDLLDLADGRIGEQTGGSGDDDLRGSAAQDVIFARGGDDIIMARGSDDEVHGQAGDDVISAGAGDDQADGGPGDDIIAGEQGDDAMRGGPGDDSFVFNFGDGDDFIDAFSGDDDDVDTISFGVDITPEMVTVTVDADGMLRLSVDYGDGGSIRMPWFDTEEGFSPIDPPAVRRVQFVDADGAVRVFDFAGLVGSRMAELVADSDDAVQLFADADGFELTGTVAPAGAGHAVAYAQTGDLFADPYYAGGNAASDNDDAVIGSDAGEDIDAGGGNDVVSAGGGSDFVDGGAGDDHIDGGAGDDELVGGEGDDVLVGGSGDDSIEAGPGDDLAAGGDGNDFYYFDRGDGTLTVEDVSADNGPNAVVFGDGISSGELRLGYEGSFLILDAGDGDRVRLSGFEPSAPFDRRAVDNYYFADGSQLTYEDLLQRGFDLEGTPGSDAIQGTALGDRITALDGDDLLQGGQGDDALDGGAGSDTYLFSLFDGADTLIDLESDAEHNVVQFGFGIESSSVHAVLDAGDLYLYYGDVGDSIRMPDVRPGDAQRGVPFDRMAFADGSTLTLSGLLANGLQIHGTPEADVLNGTEGSDTIYGFEDADLLSGGGGDDTYYIAEGGGFDTIVDSDADGQFNTVVIDHSGAQSLDDLVSSFDRDAGTLTVRVRGTDDGVALAGFDADHPFANRAADLFILQNGSQIGYDDLVARGFELDGTANADVLRGSAVHDVIRGLEGNDVIAGGTGSDVAEGGTGNDLYVFGRGDGVLTIRDEISRDAQNILAFGPGISLADLRNNLRFEAPDPAAGTPGVLRIGLGNGDEVRIEGFDPEEPETCAHAVESFRFDDGTSIDYRALVLNTFIVQGDTGDDLLYGTAIQDRLYGFEGSDELHAGDGNDTLTGGTGDDLLDGGDGGDMYVFHRGDGHDVLVDSGDNFDGNFLAFDADIDPAQLTFTQDGEDMVVSYTENDSVRVLSWNPDQPSIRQVRIGGLTTTVAGLQNGGPYAAGGLENQMALEDTAFLYQLPVDAFADPEAGVLSYYADLADGNALPSWLGFDPITRTLFGTPQNVDVGAIDLRVTAADEFGASASQTLHLAVANVNDAPVLLAPVADASATEDEPFSLILPAGTFADVDAGDLFSLTVSLANGDALPVWLGFDAATGTLSGTPANGDVGTIELRFTATDLAGASASNMFAITVGNTNDGPVLATAIADQAADEDVPFIFTLPEGTFVDVDAGDELFTFASLANGDPLPAWLSYDPDTQTFSGVPLNEDVGAFSVTLSAVDAEGASASGTFDITVANTNDAPQIGFAELEATLIEDNGLAAGAPRAALGSILFADVDLGDVHEVQLGTIASGYLGTFSAQLVEDSTDAGAPGTVQWLFSVDNGELDFLGEGETREQSYEVLVDDGHGGIASNIVTVKLTGVNDAPEAFDDAAAVQEDGTLVATGNVLTNDDDVDAGDVLSVTAPGFYNGVYGGLVLNADGGYTYTLGNGAAQSLAAGQQFDEVFTYTATDGIAFSTANLVVTITGQNDLPQVVAAEASVREDVTLVATGNVLDCATDVDASDVLAVTDPGVFSTLYGQLTLNADGSYIYELDNGHPAVQALGAGQHLLDYNNHHVTDGHTGQFPILGVLYIDIAGTNDVPTALNDVATVQEGGPLTADGNVLLNDYDIDNGDVLSVANAGTYAGSYGTLELASDGSYAYLLDDSAVQFLAHGEHVTDSFAYTASDGSVTATASLAVKINGANDAPVAETDQAMLQEDVTLIATGNVLDNDHDADASDVLSVTNAGTYVGLYGTLTLNADGSYTYDLDNAAVQFLGQGNLREESFAYDVSDGLASVSAVLQVQVHGTNDAPVAADDAASILEDMPFVSGSVTANDTDADELTVLQVANAGTYAGAYGTLTLNQFGGFSYALDTAAVQFLAEGETAQEVFAYEATDLYASSGANLTITIAGQNDAPVTQGDAASVQEDGALVATGNVLANDSDVDASDVLTVSGAGVFSTLYGTLTLASDGSYSYELQNAGAAQHLAAGQHLTESFQYHANDGHGASVLGTLNVDIAGANDSPSATVDFASVQEDGSLMAGGNLLANDIDIDTLDTLSVTSAGTYVSSYGTLTLSADGSYSYALNNAAAQVLAAGQHVTDSFSYTIADGVASATGNLLVDIAGANDAPVTVNDTAAVREDVTLVATGNVLANDSDVDGGTTLTVANAGMYGSLQLGADGSYTYTLNNASAAVQSLREGQVVADVFTYLASDGIASTTGSLTVTVNGTNDNPLAHNDAGAAQEDGPAVTLLASVLLANDTDADIGDTKAITAVSNSAAGASVTLVGGNALYSVGGLFQTLKAGATATDSFNYTIVDGAGATSTATVLMTITGVNDAPALAVPIADQNASAGSPFSFTFGAGTFTDIDVGDSLSYAASLSDGSALPSWLAFNAATRTFSGIPPGSAGGGGTGDCGCGTGGGTTPATLNLRVTATDTAGASALDTFLLNIAGGGGGGGIVPIVGTDHDDVIAGTSGNDVIDGRKGYDKMSGGAGDDIYYVDKTGSRVDLVTEGAVAGYDTVYSSANYTLGSNLEELHLIGDENLVGHGNALANMVIGNTGDNDLYGEAGNDLLLDDVGEDMLDGGAGDDVLDGGAGDDVLLGGAGNDLYVHTAGGGEDYVQDTGGTDTIRFGTGIGASNVTVNRNGNDLVLRLSGGNGSVTTKDWFSSSSKRVEQVQFADGTTWNEAAIRARITSGGSGSGSSGSGGSGSGSSASGSSGSGSHDDGHDGHDGHGGYGGYGGDDGHSNNCGSGNGNGGHDDDHGGHDHDQEEEDCGSDDYRDAIAQHLKRNPNYDFTALAQYLQRNNGGGYGAMTPQQIAQRWLQVQNCVGSLAHAHDNDCGDGHGGSHDGGSQCGDGHSHNGWGYSGSTGQGNCYGGMDGFSGLGEGFRRL